ncbi:hypothetical protein COP1_013400 [Malus domestica]
MAKAMLHDKGMPQYLWGEAVNTTVYLMNKHPTVAVEGKTPFEAWSGRKPSVNHWRVFGSICFAYVSKELRQKLDESSERCIFVCYASYTKGYRLYNLKRKKVVVCRDVLFSEKSSWDWNQATIREESALIRIEEENQPNEEEIEQEIPQLSPENSPQVHSPTPLSPSSTPVRLRSLNEVYESCNFCVVEPENFDDAVKEETWKAAMQEEINVIVKNKTWKLVDRPCDNSVIGVKWIYKTKLNQDVARHETIRGLISVAAQKGWFLHQLDVKSAFLNGVLKEEVFVDQPQGFVLKGQEHKVYKLKKALYGLKQAPRAWYGEIDSYFNERGFQRSENEPALYVKTEGTSDILIVSLYVDDLVYTGSGHNMILNFKNDMMRKYEMSDLGMLHYFLGISIIQSIDGIFITQKKYAKTLIEKFKMIGCKPVATPLVVNEKFQREDGSGDADESMYKSLVGSLVFDSD